MKYALLITLTLFLLVSLFIADPNILSWLWFSSPVLIALGIEAAHLKNKKVSRAIPIAILIIYPIGLIVFLFEHFTKTTDAQAGLATAMMPLYQLAIILIIMVVSIFRHNINNENKST